MRDVGRSLAAARDAEILSATLQGLEPIATAREKAALKALQKHLASIGSAASADALDPAIVAAAVASLSSVADGLNKLELEPGGFACIEAGLARGMK